MGIASAGNQSEAERIVKELTTEQLKRVSVGECEEVKVERGEEWTPGCECWVIAKAGYRLKKEQE